MSNKLFIAVSIPAVVLFFAATRQCPADVLERLEQVETYKWYPAQAEGICRQITHDYPGSVYALTAHKNLIISYLSAKRYDDAAQTLNQLTADFAGNSGLPAALYDVAKVYERARKYETAKGLYQQIAKQYPDSSFAAKVQLDLSKTDILSCIESKKYNETSAGIETLVNDFNDNSYLPNCLYDIARRYERAKKYEQAEVLYKRIIQQYPESFGAGSSQLAIRKINIYSLIKSGSETVGTLVDSLLTDFAGHPDLSEALYDVSIRYDRVKEYDKAKGIYQKIIEQFPASSHAARAPLDISRIEILSLIESGDDSNVQAAIDRLAADFTGHSYLSSVLLEIAKRYKKLGKYDNADRINQQAAQQRPDSSFADYSRLRTAKTNITRLIESGQDDAAAAAIDNLIVDFNGIDRSRLAKALLQGAEQYYANGSLLQREGLLLAAAENFKKAIAIGERIISKLSPSAKDAAVHLFLATIYYENMADYDRALFYFQNIVDKWPDCEYACYAQFMIAQCYAQLERTGRIPRQEAAAAIRQACGELFERYPDCLVSDRAVKFMELWSNSGK